MFQEKDIENGDLNTIERQASFMKEVKAHIR
ncbi:hypothetical protein HS7_14480 [Sulfolobales archaeon HS-7]|nr:hypothetical protein HS7_14480 [Sulfolobales archaeon HS-7]